MIHERDGEINHNRTLMLANAAYNLRHIDRSNTQPKINGKQKPTKFWTDAWVQSQYPKEEA